MLLVAASALAWPLAPDAQATPASPALRVQAYAPFTVVGTHFHPLERVKVTFQGTLIKRTKASASGRFLVVFRRAQVDACNGFVVRAAGSKGSSAVRRSPPRDCASTNPG
jgi:hypothetical protein